MSLDQLRAQAEAEEEVTEPTEAAETEDELTEEPEVEDEESSSTEEVEDDEPEETSEFELELDGEPEPGQQQKPSPEEALVYKLTKQKQKAKEYKSEIEELKAQLAEIQSGRSQAQTQPRPQQPQVNEPVFPDMYDSGIDGDRQKYDAAVKQYFRDMEAAQRAKSQQGEQESAYRQEIEQRTLNLAKQVSKFATEHRMKDDYVVEAVQKATKEIDEASKTPGGFAWLMDAVGEGGEKAAIWIGTERGAADLQRIKDALAEDPKGFKAVSLLTRIAARKPAQKKISKAPDPDQPLRGDGSSASAKSLQDKFDKASDRNDLPTMRELSRKAKELGVRLK